MNRSYHLPFVVLLFILATVLCGCPPLDYKIYVRNMTADTALLTLIHKTAFDTISNRSIPVAAAHEIVPINKKSFSRLTDTLIASADSGKVTLVLPPKSTVFVRDLWNSFHMFLDNRLVIEYNGESDTMTANYPYKNLHGFKRKPDPSYNYFYRTIVYYDIR